VILIVTFKQCHLRGVDMSEDVRATTRLPKKIAEWLKKQAKEKNRSMNGQLIANLERLMRQEESEQA